jgi:hypothetical protein
MANDILKTLTTFICKRNKMLAPAIALVLGIAPLSALATTFTANNYNALQTEAASTTSTNDTIKLGADITDGAAQLTIGHSLVLDLNGHDLRIILYAVTVGNGIKITSGVTLTITDSSSGGKLTVRCVFASHVSGEGAGINTTDGTLIIESGTVQATGGNYGAGIGGGGGSVGNGGNITISGGIVEASGGGYGAGIGGGFQGAGGTITISGTANVTANSTSTGAGIGGGWSGAGGTITISGTANVTANSDGYGAGIGGGDGSDGGAITISGGNITATGGNNGGAGIGSGRNGSSIAYSNRILITGENTVVRATGGGFGAQDIGFGNGDNGSMRIFVALPAANLTLNSQSANNVQFTANPESSGTVTATLPSQFSNQTVNLLTGLNTTGKPMSVITTLTTQSVTFALEDYDDVIKTGEALMTADATVPFVSYAKDITGFTIPNQVGVSTIGTNTIDVTMPYGTDVTSLTPTITVSDGASVSPLSGAAQDFTNPVTYTVTAANGSTKTYTVTVTVSTDVPPTITTASLSGGTVGTAYSQTLEANGAAPITWSITGSLPGGLTLSGNTISGTPTTAGTATFTVKAENVAGDDTKLLSITVNPAPVIVVPNPDPAPDPTIYVTGVRLNLTTLEGKVGDDGVELIATVAPRFATDRNVRWSTSDPLVATVTHYGLVNFVGAGTATITVITLDGDYTAECVVTVSTDTGTEGIDSALKVYFQGNTLHVCSPAAETIEVYSFSGERIFSAKKGAGEATFTVPTSQKAVIVRGSSGWTKKAITNYELRITN